MFGKKEHIIGHAYRLKIEDEAYDVTLISKEGDRASVLIQNHSIRTSLDGISKRKKIYSQAVPIRTVSLSELKSLEAPKAKRGLGNWLDRKSVV